MNHDGQRSGGVETARSSPGSGSRVSGDGVRGEPSITPTLVSIRGHSGSGKTSLIEVLVPVLRRYGLHVATLKHASHPLQLDTPGKDSFRHAAAGASPVVLVGPAATAIFIYEDGPQEMDAWLQWFTGRAEIVLVEGFSRAALPAIVLERTVAPTFRLEPGQPGELPQWTLCCPRTGVRPVEFPDHIVERLAAWILELRWSSVNQRAGVDRKVPEGSCGANGLAGSSVRDRR